MRAWNIYHGVLSPNRCTTIGVMYDHRCQIRDNKHVDITFSAHDSFLQCTLNIEI